MRTEEGEIFPDPTPEFILASTSGIARAEVYTNPVYVWVEVAFEN